MSCLNLIFKISSPTLWLTYFASGEIQVLACSDRFRSHYRIIQRIWYTGFISQKSHQTPWVSFMEEKSSTHALDECGLRRWENWVRWRTQTALIEKRCRHYTASKLVEQRQSAVRGFHKLEMSARVKANDIVNGKINTRLQCENKMLSIILTVKILILTLNNI